MPYKNREDRLEYAKAYNKDYYEFRREDFIWKSILRKERCPESERQYAKKYRLKKKAEA